MNLSFLRVDLNDDVHCKQLIRLLDCYMQDEMGGSEGMSKGIDKQIISGLKDHPSYLGFFVLVDDGYAALANCNRNFSTFKAKPLLNIHDFVVVPEYREKGIGQFMLDSLAKYAEMNGFCKISLEVREDNVKARRLYQKSGFKDTKPAMLFWEKLV